MSDSSQLTKQHYINVNRLRLRVERFNNTFGKSYSLIRDKAKQQEKEKISI